MSAKISKEKDIGVEMKTFEQYMDEFQDTEEYLELTRNLTPLKIEFAHAMVECGGNGAEAIRRTNSRASKENSKKIAWSLSQDEDVLKLIAVIQKLQCYAVALSKEEIVRNFRMTYLQAMQVGNFKEANEANKALAEIMGISGKFKELSSKAMTKNNLKEANAAKTKKESDIEVLNALLGEDDKDNTNQEFEVEP